MTVAEKARQYIDRNKTVSIASVAKAIGKSTSTLSLYLRGDYAGDCKSIDKALDAFLVRQQERAKVVLEGECASTRQAQAVMATLRYAHVYGEMGVIVGSSGCGKTMAIAQYAFKQGGTIVLTIDPVSLTPSAVLADLCEAVGVSPRGTLRGLLRRICKRLEGSGRLIVVDEAQFLTHRAIESLRKIHDVAKVGLVFAGMPRLYHHMIGNGVELFEQIKNRVGIKKELPFFSEGDAALILKSLEPSISDQVCKAAYDASQACGRRMVKLYRHAARMAADKSRAITEGDFVAAQGFLYDDHPSSKAPVPLLPSKTKSSQTTKRQLAAAKVATG